MEIHGYPGHRETPYAPIVDLLERVLREDPERLGGLDPRTRAEVARLVPGFSSGEVSLPPLDETGAEARFIDALATTLAFLAGSLLLVDDAQWVDPATLSLLALVSRRPLRHNAPKPQYRPGPDPDRLQPSAARPTR